MLTDSIFRKELNAWRRYNVYVPKSFDAEPNRNYPILYLLHGMMDTNVGWDARGHVKEVMDMKVASGEVDEMILVTPDAGGKPGECWNGYFNMPGWPYEDFFFNEFMPAVEAKYRAGGDRGRRAIAGLSMGGGGSTSYAQRHPELFGSVYAMSALMELPEDRSPAPDATDKVSLLYKSVEELNCVDYVKNADEATKAALRTVKWYVDCGDDDFLLPCNIKFFQAMRAAGIPIEFRINDGGHTWEYWRAALHKALPFATRNFK